MNWRARRRSSSRCRPLAELLEARQLLALSIHTLPAEQITLRSATIGVEVVEFDETLPEVILFWGDDDAGRRGGNWDNRVDFHAVDVGRHTIQLEQLDVDTSYFYRGLAIDLSEGQSVWTDVATFQTLPPAPPQLEGNPVAIVGGINAQLSGRITDDGGDQPLVTVYFGTTDGGDDPQGWDRTVDLDLQGGEFSTWLDGLLPNTTYYARVAAQNSSGVAWTVTDRFTTVPIAPLSISEFMAANGTTIVSRTRPTAEDSFPRTRKAYDWIEIQNATAEPVDVSAYHLTDDFQLPLKWSFPEGTVIPAQGQIIVYASGEDIRDPVLDDQGWLHTNFQLSRSGESLALVDRLGQVVHEYRNVPDQLRDVSYGTYANSTGHFDLPTPGLPNRPLAPDVAGVVHQFITTGDPSSAILVTARVEATVSPVSEVSLRYRVMYEDERTVQMRDDGAGGDALAADGVFSAMLPGDLATVGQMLRYCVTATSANGMLRREPNFVDEKASPEYFGMIVAGPALDSRLPVMHWFVENSRRADTSSGTRASLFYDGEFYDNVFVRIRGGTARGWPKKSYKLEFNDDHQFLLNPQAPRVDEINLNATYTDKSYLRSVLTAEFQLDAGTPSPETYHVRVQQNNEFYSVAFVVEQPDLDFLRRHQLDPEGSLYKAGPGSYYTGSTGSFEKKSRDDDDKSDLSNFMTGLKLRDEELERFLFDNANLPAQINFMATNIVAQNIDASDKNHYIYRDTNGTGEWFMMPWDLDLVFGPDALNTDKILADEDTRGATYPNAVHPYLGSRRWPLHAGKINMFLDAIINTPRTNEMLLRRVRTLTDQFLASGYFHDRIDELVELLQEEVPLDRQKWGRSAHFPGILPPYDSEADRIKSSYLDRRLTYLTDYQVSRGDGQRDFVGIPHPQIEEPRIQFGEVVVFDPASGNQQEEYFTLFNPHDVAVDVSGWQITGATTATLQAGTVIPGGDVLYLSSNVPAFRARTAGPAGNQGLFVQSYLTELPNTGGELELLDASGGRISQTVFGLQATPAGADNLRVTEIHFNPRDGLPRFGELLAGGSTFEFVELANIGVQPIELAGVRFVTQPLNGSTEGIAFTFASQTLAAEERLVVVVDRAAFQTRYGSQVRIAAGDDGQGGLPGQYAQKLSNGGETLTLVDASGGLIQQVTYGDDAPWPERADGVGSSLEIIDPQADYAQPDQWQASSELGGSPGRPPGPVVRDVLINEILANSETPWIDQIELLNVTDETVDVEHWYLSDSGGDLLNFQISGDDTQIPPGGFLVFDQRQLGFGFKGQQSDDAWLIAADATGRPLRFADQVLFDATPQNVSLGRWPDGQGPLLPMTRLTFGAGNSGPAGPAEGDFNSDGRVDRDDVDQLSTAIRGDQYEHRFDLNGDDWVDFDDQVILIRDILGTTFGDANLDGRFDSQDLLAVFRSGVYEDKLDGNASWSSGDWNSDGEFNSRDFVLAFTYGGYRETPAQPVDRLAAIDILLARIGEDDQKTRNAS